MDLHIRRSMCCAHKGEIAIDESAQVLRHGPAHEMGRNTNLFLFRSPASFSLGCTVGSVHVEGGWVVVVVVAGREWERLVS